MVLVMPGGSFSENNMIRRVVFCIKYATKTIRGMAEGGGWMGGRGEGGMGEAGKWGPLIW